MGLPTNLFSPSPLVDTLSAEKKNKIVGMQEMLSV
jgi:hypothetical protein